MKKTGLIALGCMIFFACNKKDAQPPAPDYSQYKIKTAVHSARTFSGGTSSYSADSVRYTYEGTTYKYTQWRNGSVYEYTVTLAGGLYTQELYVNGALSNQKTYSRLNAAGYIDSSWVTNSGTITQGSRYSYNADGSQATGTTYFGNYTNRIQYNYKNGQADNAHSERIAHIPSITNADDSVVFTYAANLPFRTDYYSSGLPPSLLGKQSKNLLQKTTYYDKLNSNTIRQTIDYEYQADNAGLVTKRVYNIYTQPGNIPLITDTTFYTYYGK